jgi:hypothetical protein
MVEVQAWVVELLRFITSNSSSNGKLLVVMVVVMEVVVLTAGSAKHWRR